eukprot:gene14968-17698_t
MWASVRKEHQVDTEKMLMDEMLDYSGTKGKGSTCAIVESILRRQGFTTGLFTSPHLVSPRERIKINGELVSKELFSEQFWYCWDAMIKAGMEAPPFFKFTMLIALRVFQTLKVDCTIMEVGIGGRVDSTNIFPKPLSTGITSLGLDHTNVLGDTIQEIAFEKAGIIKTGCPIFTVDQKPEAMEVIKNRALHVKAPLNIVSTIDEYKFTGKIGLEGEHQKQNTALALALVNSWIINNKNITAEKRETLFSGDAWRNYDLSINNYSPADFTPLSDQVKKGIACVEWPGRAQHFSSPDFPSIDFYLDGAHTQESAIVCLDWWKSVVKKDEEDGSSKNTTYVFVYNSTGGRNTASFLTPFTNAIKRGEIPSFEQAIFPGVTYERPSDLKTPLNSHTTNHHTDATQTWEETVARVYVQQLDGFGTPIATQTAECMIECLERLVALGKVAESAGRRVKVLSTGSLYLVGGLLKGLLKENAAQ